LKKNQGERKKTGGGYWLAKKKTRKKGNPDPKPGNFTEGWESGAKRGVLIAIILETMAMRQKRAKKDAIRKKKQDKKLGLLTTSGEGIHQFGGNMLLSTFGGKEKKHVCGGIHQ